MDQDTLQNNKKAEKLNAAKYKIRIKELWDVKWL